LYLEDIVSDQGPVAHLLEIGTWWMCCYFNLYWHENHEEELSTPLYVLVLWANRLWLCIWGSRSSWDVSNCWTGKWAGRVKWSMKSF